MLSRSPCPVNTSVNAWLIFVVKMAIVAFVVSLFVISVSCLLGVSFTAFTIYSIYLFYVHWKYSHLPGPKRDSSFFGNIPLIRREREPRRIMHELVQDLHSKHGPVVPCFLHSTARLFSYLIHESQENYWSLLICQIILAFTHIFETSISARNHLNSRSRRWGRCVRTRPQRHHMAMGYSTVSFTRPSHVPWSVLLVHSCFDYRQAKNK